MPFDKSRPQSNNSRETLYTGLNFLSPADADRPIPLPADKSAPPPNTNLRGYPSGTPATSSSVPIVLPDGQLPPGFIPAAPSIPPTPVSRSNNSIYSSGPSGNSTTGPNNHSTSGSMPGGFPSMADQYMSLSTRRSFRDL